MRAAQKVEDGAISLFLLNGRRVARKANKLDGNRVHLQSYDREFTSQTLPAAEARVLAKCVKLDGGCNMRLFCDLHIHSCLSPCGDELMTPNNIAGMAMLKGLDAIAVADHNSARICRRLPRPARGWAYCCCRRWN